MQKSKSILNFKDFLLDILIKFVTSKVLKNVTMGLGAFIHSLYADSLVVSFGLISLAIMLFPPYQRDKKQSVV